ncbi:MAG: polyphosphate kinase 1 [Verrucomicrobiota bacterium]|nr:polyphosphate kinase 1 [Verrucomicrobiota bacterium]
MTQKQKQSRFINRELSWLEFNSRVLEEAMDSKNPLLERIKFFCIANSNMDEFFEVRVAGLKQQIESAVVERSMDGRTATEIFDAVSERVHEMVDELFRCWRQDLMPSLAKKDLRFHQIDDLSPNDRKWVETFYREQVRPVLTPLAVDPSKAFPLIVNKSLNVIGRVELKKGRSTEQRLCIVQVPRVIPRLVQLPRPDRRQDYVFLADIISYFIDDLFPGTKVLGAWRFRVTRNSELYVGEEDIENLLQAVENELRNRRKGDAVRLEVDHNTPDDLVAELLEKLELSADDLYRIDGPVNPIHLQTICQGDHSPELREPPFIAPSSPAFRGRTDLFEVIRQQDVLVHHPYESFDCVVDFLNQAASDPKVLAIKLTLYRTGGDPRVVGALMRAAQNGKPVAAVVELKARFDEANNIHWARELEEAGVHVSYGLVGYKIHSKVCLVVRQEEDGLRRYVHLSTGNYNPTTAKLYTDLGLFTCRPEYGEDATVLFNLLTGFCEFQGAKKLVVAPFEFQRNTLEHIRRETHNAREGKPAAIRAKMNSLVDKPVIEALYEASKAGVEIDLIVRGICCLRPGVRGLSENIRVRSIVDRFLEHSRIFYYENNGNPKLYVSSGDWMYRNFQKRIEVAFPVEDPAIQQRLLKEILPAHLNDNVKARELLPDATYQRTESAKGKKAYRSQFELITMTKPMFKSSTTKKGALKLPKFEMVKETETTRM